MIDGSLFDLIDLGGLQPQQTMLMSIGAGRQFSAPNWKAVFGAHQFIPPDPKSLLKTVHHGANVSQTWSADVDRLEFGSLSLENDHRRVGEAQSVAHSGR